MPTERYQVQQRALSAEPLLTALEITHPAAAAPIRVVNDVVNHEIGGATYVALRFEAQLLDDRDGRPPRAEIALDNVGAAMTKWIELTQGGAGAAVRCFQTFPGAAEPEWEVTVDVAAVRCTQTQVTATLGFEPLLGRRAVRWRHDAQTTPGLF